ncbi:UNVERIFIED_ORG: hypothetical protein GGD48_004900 [Rhizobium etli]
METEALSCPLASELAEVVAFHNGDLRAAIITLLEDIRHLRHQVVLVEGAMSKRPGARLASDLRPRLTMPEMNYSKKLRGWSLRIAADANQLLQVTCQFCRRTYRFFPNDLLKLTADVSLDRLAGRFRCEICNRGDFMSLKVVQIWGAICLFTCSMRTATWKELLDLGIRRKRRPLGRRFSVSLMLGQVAA